VLRWLCLTSVSLTPRDQLLRGEVANDLIGSRVCERNAAWRVIARAQSDRVQLPRLTDTSGAPVGN